jgi:NADH:ubiquinone oxidoreductase subunit 4 (subunit M)
LLLGEGRPANAGMAASGGRLSDASPRELATLASVAFLALLLGVWPTPLLTAVASSARDVADTVEPSAFGSP